MICNILFPVLVFTPKRAKPRQSLPIGYIPGLHFEGHNIYINIPPIPVYKVGRHIVQVTEKYCIECQAWSLLYQTREENTGLIIEQKE